jgi:hypothetical protein
VFEHLAAQQQGVRPVDQILLVRLQLIVPIREGPLVVLVHVADPVERHINREHNLSHEHSSFDLTMGAERAAAVEKRVTNSALQMMDR